MKQIAPLRSHKIIANSQKWSKQSKKQVKRRIQCAIWIKTRWSVFLAFKPGRKSCSSWSLSKAFFKTTNLNKARNSNLFTQMWSSCFAFYICQKWAKIITRCRFQSTPNKCKNNSFSLIFPVSKTKDSGKELYLSFIDYRCRWLWIIISKFSIIVRRNVGLRNILEAWSPILSKNKNSVKPFFTLNGHWARQEIFLSQLKTCATIV